MTVVTIFTDASFDPRNRAAGWSAWVKFGPALDQTVRLFGPVKDDPCSALGAELAAIANVLHAAARSLRLGADDLVILQTDCLTAIDVIEGRSRRPLRRKFVAACKGNIDQTLQAHGFRLDLRHVKAHQGGHDRRSWVNEWCDTAAKTQMRRKRSSKMEA